MKKQLGSSLVALLMAFSSTVTLSTDVFAHDTTSISNTVSTVSTEQHTASGEITFDGTEGKYKDGTKPCCIGCFSKYLVAVAEDGTEHSITVTKTDTWAGTWEVEGITDGNYTTRITNEYEYYYGFLLTGSFTVEGGDVIGVKLSIIDQTCSASGDVNFLGTAHTFEDGSEICCIGCFNDNFVITDSNGIQQKAYFSKTDTWDGSWIVSDLKDGDYTLGLAKDFEYFDLFEIKDGSFTIDNQDSINSLSFDIVDISSINSIVTTASTPVSTVVETIVETLVQTIVEIPVNETVTMAVPSTMVQLLGRLF